MLLHLAPTPLRMESNSYCSKSQKFLASQSIVELAKRTSVVTLPSDGCMRPLGPDFQGPGRYDVICARGKEALHHSGNVHFRGMISQALDEYSRAGTKVKKSQIISTIVDRVRALSPSGGFVKKKKGEWFEVGDHIAREKCGQSLRDLLHTKYKSSTKAKMRKRKFDNDVSAQDSARASGGLALRTTDALGPPASMRDQVHHPATTIEPLPMRMSHYLRFPPNTPPVSRETVGATPLWAARPPLLEEHISASIFDPPLYHERGQPHSATLGAGFAQLPTERLPSDGASSSDDRSPNVENPYNTFGTNPFFDTRKHTGR